MLNLRNQIIRLAHENPELREDLLPLVKEASLAGSYADYMYEGEKLFLDAAMKLIKGAVGGHAERLLVRREGGRGPLLIYEGQDLSDMDLEFTAHLIPQGTYDVSLSWFGKSASRGSFNDQVKMKWGHLTPQHVVNVFRSYFGIL